MKIIFFVGTFPSISEQFILNQIVGLLQKKIDVSIISVNESNENKVHPDYEKYNLEQKVLYLKIPEKTFIRYIVGVSIITKFLLRGKIGILREALSVKKYNRSTLSLKNLFILDLLYKSPPIEVMHCHFGPMGVTGSFLKTIGFVKKLIVTFHGSDINTYPKRNGHDVYKYMYTQVDRITCNTNFTAEKVIQNGASRDKISILPVGLDMNDYQIIERVEPFSRPSILTVARLVEKKGYPFALEAIAILKKTFPNIEYHIVGSGPLDENIRNLIHKYNIQENVIMHGLCSRAEIEKIYSISDIFLLPSITASDGDMEGQGLVLQEAQAVGLPVISTLHNGIPDGVLDGETGFLVPEKDPVAIAEKCRYLLESPEVRKKMGMKGHDFVKGKYDISILTDEIIQVYGK